MGDRRHGPKLLRCRRDVEKWNFRDGAVPDPADRATDPASELRADIAERGSGEDDAPHHDPRRCPGEGGSGKGTAAQACKQATPEATRLLTDNARPLSRRGVRDAFYALVDVVDEPLSAKLS